MSSKCPRTWPEDGHVLEMFLNMARCWACQLNVLELDQRSKMSSKCQRTWSEVKHVLKMSQNMARGRSCPPNVLKHGLISMNMDRGLICPQQKSICPKTWPEVGHVLKMSYTVICSEVGHVFQMPLKNQDCRTKCAMLYTLSNIIYFTGGRVRRFYHDG